MRSLEDTKGDINALEGLEPISLRAMRENTMLYKLLLNSIVYRVTQR